MEPGQPAGQAQRHKSMGSAAKCVVVGGDRLEGRLLRPYCKVWLETLRVMGVGRDEHRVQRGGDQVEGA